MTIQPRSLRTQLTAAVALLVLIVVGLAGLIIALRIDHRERSDVDRQMLVQADKVRADVDKLLTNGGTPDQHPTDQYGELLQGSQSLVRLRSGGAVVAERGDQPTGPIPTPSRPGFTTLIIDGQPWRSLVQPLDAAGSDQLQILQNLQSLEQRLDDNRRIVILVTAAATLLAAVGAWIVAGLLLRPLQRLRGGALRIQPTDTDQLPQIHRPQEVADLSGTLNTMLARLQTAMVSTRRFTADAGHEIRTPLSSLGMDLETLVRNPNLPDDQRHAILTAMSTEHGRLVAVLDGLQTLARGDAGALPAREHLDLADLAAGAMDHAQHRYPQTTFTWHDSAGTAPIAGWATGLRLAIDNLLDNAARHGKPHGTVEITIRATAEHVIIMVDDDGPGIPADQREAMTQRFTRGPNPRSTGTGLGLALVQQQATLHNGTLVLADAATGGLSATLSLPAAP
jgi:two-component system, OmpR family, sensor histidine kinase PrrB